MIGPVSSNRSVFTSAAVVVVSSVVFGVFLSRIGWHGAMQQYPAAMYMLMGGGGAAFACLCVALSRRKAPVEITHEISHHEEQLNRVVPVQHIDEPPNVRQVKELLLNPPRRQENVIDALQNALGCSQPLANLVFDYMVFPIEKCFLRLKMGIRLEVGDPNYEKIKDSLVKYQRFYRGAVEKILDPVPLEIAYVRLYGFARAYREALYDSENERAIFCNICVMLLHAQTSDKLVNLNEVESQFNMAGNYCVPMRFIAMQNDLEAMTCFLNHIHLEAKGNGRTIGRFFAGDDDFNMTEEMALLILETGLQALAKSGQDQVKFKIDCERAAKQGWAIFINRMLELKDRNTFFRDGNIVAGWSFILWQSLVRGAYVKAKGRQEVSVFENFNEIQKGNFVGVAIALVKNRIDFPRQLAKPFREINLADLQKLFLMLDDICGKPSFVGTLNDQELLTFNERIKQDGFVT